MSDQITQLRDEALAAIAAAADEGALEDVRIAYLGRKGSLNLLRKSIGTLPPDERPAFGAAINAAADAVEEMLTGQKAAFARGERINIIQLVGAATAHVPADTLDVTLPGRAPRIGKQHPLLATMEDMIAIFLGLGFTVAEGPEVENYHYSFDALNYPEYHPAMDEQMTFYVRGAGVSPDNGDVLLRSQTSTVQIRTMEHQQPPVRVIVPGRCYRRDTVDATHCHTFHQLEGLLVDEGITFADLKGTFEAFARGMFGDKCHARFRPDFFPFTEPSAEMALTCTLCWGGGCRVCSNTGYLEVGGCGMVDPNVLAGVGYDTEKYTGFAFGVGIERFTMLRHGIDDIRLFYSGDMRFLGQF